MIDNRLNVNRTAYMDFKEATDGLFERISHEDLADALGVSVASIRQARLDPSANAYRQPPSNWLAAVARLAAQRAEHLQNLIENLHKTGKP